MIEPTPSAPPTPPVAVAPQDSSKGWAIASLVVGIINLCAWFIPLCGGPLSIVGIVLGVLGMKSTTQRTLAIVGIVLSGLGLLASIVNAVLGAYLGTQGFNFNLGQ